MGLNNEELIDFMRGQLVRQTNGDMVISINPHENTKPTNQAA